MTTQTKETVLVATGTASKAKNGETHMRENNTSAPPEQAIPVTFTCFTSRGPLSKSYSLDDAGKIIKTPAAAMARGTATRIKIDFAKFGEALAKADTQTAFAYGVHPATFPDEVRITLSNKEDEASNRISRTQAYFKYADGPGILMCDHDTCSDGPAMTPDELEAVMAAICPGFQDAARLSRASLSAGIHKAGEPAKTGSGFHLYVAVRNAADIPRFGKVLAKRLWLNGYGYISVSGAGSFLIRSILDSAVYSPERLDFVGKPIVGAGLVWDAPQAFYKSGGFLDTSGMADLTDEEAARYNQLVAEAKAAKEPERVAVKEVWDDRQVSRMVESGVSEEKAKAAIKRMKPDGSNLPGEFVLEFLNGETATVAEVLKNPQAFNDRTLPDPLEGSAYGKTTARFFANQGGVPCIYSFAHGGQKYSLGNAKKTKPKAKDTNTADGTDGEKVTQAELLIELAAPATLFHTPTDERFAIVPANSHKEICPVRSKAFREWLGRLFYNAEGKPAQPKAVQAAVELLDARAGYDGAEHPVYVRVAEHDGNVYLDLCNPAWEVVEITREGWSVVSESPAKFRRAKGMLPLPHPVKGGSLNDLRPFINCPDDSVFKLLCGFLVGSLNPLGPYPILTLEGEQGTGKSHTARVLRSCVDPAKAMLKTAPRDERDLMISATNGWLVAYDNLSGVEPWLSDALCRLATGGGFSTRQLYSNDEETIFEATRPQILTGIDRIAARHDLIDRSIIAVLPVIGDSKRKEEKKLSRDFEAARPRILGALCDAACCALRNIETIKLTKLPRMADFAKWVAAAEGALPWKLGEFMDAYTGNRDEAISLALDADVVASAVRQLMEGRTTWTGTPTELLAKLREFITEDTHKSRAWPKAANGLTKRLRRIATFLRAEGIEIDLDGKTTDSTRTRIVTFTKSTQNTVRTVRTVRESSQNITQQGFADNDSRTVPDDNPDGSDDNASGATNTVRTVRTITPDDNKILSSGCKPLPGNGSDGSDGSDGEMLILGNDDDESEVF